jgi:uracil-DNA glycosylase
MNALELGLALSHCEDVEKALLNRRHPCHKVVSWQPQKTAVSITRVSGSQLHRPEAWTGDLENAPIMIVASNPSFNADEAFPDWTGDWSDEEITRFAAERFLSSPARPFGATDGPELSKADRVYLKNGLPSPGKHVAYWREIRRRVSEILGKNIEDVSAHTDYVMTELVHCKSEKEIGVEEALSHCAQKWTEKIFELSPAKLIVVMGKKPAMKMLELFPNIPDTWGAWKDAGTQRGDWPTSKKDLTNRKSEGTWTSEQQAKHSVQIVLGGIERTLIWLPRPNSSYPRSLDGEHAAVSEEIVSTWRSKIVA